MENRSTIGEIDPTSWFPLLKKNINELFGSTFIMYALGKGEKGKKKHTFCTLRKKSIMPALRKMRLKVESFNQVLIQILGIKKQ